MGVMDAIERIADGFDGEIGLAARDLRTGETVLHHPDRRCATASVIKLPILLHTLLLAAEGVLSLDETVTLVDADKVPGAGILTQLTGGLQVSLRDACTLMIALSDNTATNMVLDRVGIDAVNARLRSLGLRHTTLFRKVYSSGPPVSEENRRFGLGMTTPREILRLLTAIHAGEIGDGATSAKARRFLARQQDHNGIPRLLPPDARFEGKSGAVDRVRNDVGFVILPDGHEIALAIFCQQMGRILWTADNPGLCAIAQLARLIVGHFRPDIISNDA